MTIDLSNLPTQVTVAVGQRHEVPLPPFSGSGNAWSATPISGADVADVIVVLGDAPSAPTPNAEGTTPPPTATVVPERAVIVGLSPGMARWRLVLARSFGPPVATAEHVFDVRVE